MEYVLIKAQNNIEDEIKFGLVDYLTDNVQFKVGEDTIELGGQPEEDKEEKISLNVYIPDKYDNPIATVEFDLIVDQDDGISYVIKSGKLKNRMKLADKSGMFVNNLVKKLLKFDSGGSVLNSADEAIKNIVDDLKRLGIK